MMRHKLIGVLSALGLAVSLVHAQELVTNGGFETNTGNGQLGVTTSATGWSVPSGGYTFLFNPATGTTSGTTADNGGANGQYGYLGLWGPGTGENNGLTVSSTGGAFIAQDSAFQQRPIEQTINGLTIGQQYKVKFEWALAQQQYFSGPTWDAWQVTFGSERHDTATLTLPNHGFSGWKQESFTYTATSTSQVLSFFADGGPAGVPPFSLLDSVSVQAVPEPGAFAGMLTGIAGFSSFARRRRAAKARG